MSLATVASRALAGIDAPEVAVEVHLGPGLPSFTIVGLPDAEVREARDRMLAARDLTAYYGQVLLPQRVRILDLTMRHYNLMFKGAYDLLLAKQAEVEAEKVYLEAWRNYWIARARLEKALGGALPATAPAPASGAADQTPAASSGPQPHNVKEEK